MVTLLLKNGVPLYAVRDFDFPIHELSSNQCVQYVQKYATQKPAVTHLVMSKFILVVVFFQQQQSNNNK